MEWHYTQTNPSEELAQLHTFTMKKRHPGGDVNFRITVIEYAAPPAGQRVRFFAQADKQVNQKTAALLPSGWRLLPPSLAPEPRPHQRYASVPFALDRRPVLDIRKAFRVSLEPRHAGRKVGE